MKTLHFEHSVYIQRPKSEVFAYLSDFNNYHHVFSANINSKQTSEGPVQPGTTMRNLAKFLWKNMEEHFVVVDYEPGKRIFKKSLPGSTFYTTDEMLFEEENGQTKLTVKVYAEITGFMKLFAGAIRKKVASILVKDLDNFRDKMNAHREIYTNKK
ncbi:MAG: SRPBCC family protein [Bacteroidota bacterium]